MTHPALPTRDGAELLHQPVLLQFFDRRIQTMSPRRRDTALVKKVHLGLNELRPLVGITDNVEISEKTVNEINAILDQLVKAIGVKANN